VFFQILDRDTFTVGPGGEIVPDGNPQPPLPQENGWKDTALVGPGEILRVIARFEDYKGKYAYHCHILEHEDHEMMRQFQTVRCGDAELDPSEDCDDGGKTPADGCSADCKDEEFVELRGTALGDGDVAVVIAGQTVTVTPSPGDTPATVAAALAAAIEAEPGLAALGITAVVRDGRLVLNAPFDDVLVDDGGLLQVLWLEVTADLLWWSSVGGASGYDVVEGAVSGLSSGFDVATETCLENDTVSHKRSIPADGAAGEARWFLTRTTGGSYDTGGSGQTASRDAGIEAICP
jgi:cysteine-rich repeat protein